MALEGNTSICHCTGTYVKSSRGYCSIRTCPELVVKMASRSTHVLVQELVVTMAGKPGIWNPACTESERTKEGRTGLIPSVTLAVNPDFALDAVLFCLKPASLFGLTPILLLEREAKSPP